MSRSQATTLTRELREFVRERVKSGLYRDEGEVIREGLRLLRQRELASRQITAMIEEGWADSEAGRESDGEAFMDELEASIDRRPSRRRTR